LKGEGDASIFWHPRRERYRDSLEILQGFTRNMRAGRPEFIAVLKDHRVRGPDCQKSWCLLGHAKDH
jgi:hypothetical protein